MFKLRSGGGARRVHQPCLEVANNDFGTLQSFRFFAGGTSGGFTASAAVFDEVRFGASFAAVATAIPEPSTYTAILGGCGLLAAVSRRRRRA